jgi:hypothetical protein
VLPHPHEPILYLMEAMSMKRDTELGERLTSQKEATKLKPKRKIGFKMQSLFRDGQEQTVSGIDASPEFLPRSTTLRRAS